MTRSPLQLVLERPQIEMRKRAYMAVATRPGGSRRTHDDLLDEPLRWRKPRMVFVNSMSDLFHEEIPDTFIAAVYDVIRRSPRHVFQVLTKRPQRALDWHLQYASAFERFGDSPWPLPNVWLGVSIESWRFNWRATVLRRIPAAVRFISAEPLLDTLYGKRTLDLDGIDWVIVGGESGHGARPMHPAWAIELRDASTRAGASFFFKQWGAWADGSTLGRAPERDRVVTYDGRVRTHDEWRDEGYAAGAGHARPVAMHLSNKKAAGRELDGRVWNEWPTPDRRQPLEQRFLQYVEKTSECWLWTGHRDAKGYGRFLIAKGQSDRAHRVAYRLWRGAIPRRRLVHHRCHNPSCVRPDHLEALSQRDHSRAHRRTQ